jgi:small subunit ribosomal protein S26e
MPKKRRNNGRNLCNKGKSISVHCNNCTRLVPKDKAIKRFIIKPMVDGSSNRDINDASAYKDSETPVQVPKLYIKNQWCVACAIHARIVKVRKTEEKRIRYVSKFRPDQKTELNKLYRIANKKIQESHNPFKNQEKDEE